MDNLTEQSIDAAAKEQLANGATSLHLGKIALALDAHEAIHALYMGQIEEDEALEDHALSHLLAHFDIAPENDDYLCAELNDGREEKTVFFFSDESIVMVMGTDSLEPICEMSEKQFFRYLHTLPNILAWADARKPMATGSPEGLHLLRRLADLPTES